MQSFRLMKAPLPPLFDSVCLDFGIIPQGAAMNFSQTRPKLIDSHFKVLLTTAYQAAATVLLFGPKLGGQLLTLPTHH